MERGDVTSSKDLVLLVEHDPRVRDGLTRMLRRAGLLVAAVADATSAMARLEVRGRLPKVALVSLDHDAQNALALIGEAKVAGTKVMALSFDTRLREAARKAGAAAFLEKDGHLTGVLPSRVMALIAD